MAQIPGPVPFVLPKQCHDAWRHQHVLRISSNDHLDPGLRALLPVRRLPCDGSLVLGDCHGFLLGHGIHDEDAHCYEVHDEDAHCYEVRDKDALCNQDPHCYEDSGAR